MLTKEVISNLKIIVEIALTEDLGKGFSTNKSHSGDITTDALGLDFVEKVSTSSKPRASKKKEKLSFSAYGIAKENLIFCGKDIVEYYLKHYTKITCKFENGIHDGAVVKPYTKLFFLFGNGREILKHERIILNLLQYLSGIATKVFSYQKILSKTNIKLLDTRKTLPGYRALSKYAVIIGGGENHRQGLFDHYMIKDNHISFMNGDIVETLLSVVKHKKLLSKKKSSWKSKRIIVECSTIGEVKSTLPYLKDIDQILLDNMSPKIMKTSTRFLRLETEKQNTNIKIEASGSMNQKKIKKIKKIDLDYISVGALTHSVISKDISLEFV